MEQGMTMKIHTPSAELLIKTLENFALVDWVQLIDDDSVPTSFKYQKSSHFKNTCEMMVKFNPIEEISCYPLWKYDEMFKGIELMRQKESYELVERGLNKIKNHMRVHYVEGYK
jgi:hypothetical protein